VDQCVVIGAEYVDDGPLFVFLAAAHCFSPVGSSAGRVDAVVATDIV